MPIGNNNADFATDEVSEKMLDYLDKLQDSGETNMYGAGLYVSRKFSLSTNEASDVLGYWMETWEQRHPDD